MGLITPTYIGMQIIKIPCEDYLFLYIFWPLSIHVLYQPTTIVLNNPTIVTNPNPNPTTTPSSLRSVPNPAATPRWPPQPRFPYFFLGKETGLGWPARGSSGVGDRAKRGWGRGWVGVGVCYDSWIIFSWILRIGAYSPPLFDTK